MNGHGSTLNGIVAKCCETLLCRDNRVKPAFKNIKGVDHECLVLLLDVFIIPFSMVVPSYLQMLPITSIDDKVPLAPSNTLASLDSSRSHDLASLSEEVEKRNILSGESCRSRIIFL